MKAVIYSQTGELSGLVIKEIAKPEPKAHQVLVKVEAVALNIADYAHFEKEPTMMTGVTDWAMGLKNQPIGAELSGQVVAVGRDVQHVQVGDKVFGKAAGFSPKGALAEYALMDKDRVAVMPECWTFEEASCVSISFDTALAGVRKAQVKAGQSVLVYGASGGAGNYAMQILLAQGAKVTAVCSTRNVAYAQKLGCQQVIDYKTEDFTKLSQRFDVILGINGCQPMAVYQKLLTPDGIFVGVGNSKQASLALIKGFFSKQFTAVAGAFKPADGYLDYAKSLAERGQLTPLIDKVYSVYQVQDAVHYLVECHAKGKVVIRADF